MYGRELMLGVLTLFFFFIMALVITRDEGFQELYSYAIVYIEGFFEVTAW